jgi:calpain-15
MKHDAELGIYSVRFCKNGEWRVITVDDHVPITKRARPYYQSVMYCKFGDVKDGVAEMWPIILEKAYAKLHGSYQAIEAGQTSDGLTDLTGHPSFSVQIQSKQGEVADGSFWNSIRGWHSSGYMMGCGSHSGSDTNHNNLGIVLGHAYSILSVTEVDGIKFMNIRNPHGTGGKEWQGDYSDKSDKWNRRLRSKLNAPEGGKEEGAWWYVVVCPAFPHVQPARKAAGRTARLVLRGMTPNSPRSTH